MFSTKNRSTAKRASQGVATLIIALILLEILSSLILLYGYRFKQSKHTNRIRSETSYFSTVNLVLLAARKTGILGQDNTDPYESKTSVEPSPFIAADPVFGYSAAPGQYIHTYHRRKKSFGDWKTFKIKVTINEDGTRWTGDTTASDKPTITIFGDSFVFGNGVNDEQTFSYLVQQALPESKVKLFALGGYSLTQAYLRFQQIKETIHPNDIVIIGYAGFLDVRHVAAPSRLRANHDGRLTTRKNTRLHPRVTITSDDTLQIDYIPEDCSNNDSYCDKADPSQDTMARVSAALINNIAKSTSADVYLLVFGSKLNDPMMNMIDQDIKIIRALHSDFDYFIRDDAEGFDYHPGPYWHYALSRRILEALQ